MGNYSQVRVNREGFATIKTPISTSGMMRHAISIEDHFNDLLNGSGVKTEINRLLFTAASAKTITSGIVSTPTLAQHTITSESGSADNLDTIGSYDGQFLAIRATTGHIITLRNGTGNITTPGGTNLILSGNMTALLWCADGQWSVMGTTLARMNPSATTDPGSGDDALDGYSIGSLWVNTSKKRAWICVDNTAAAAIWKSIGSWMNGFSVRAAGTVFVPVGIGATTTDANTTYSSSNQSTNPFILMTATAPGTTDHSTRSPSFNLVRPSHDPIAEFYVRTDSSVTDLRFWVGICSQALLNSDTQPASAQVIGFRFKHGTDAGWIPILYDGTTQSPGSAIGSVAVSTDYLLRIRVDSANTQAFFSVNDGAEQAFSTNFPVITSELGWSVCYGAHNGAVTPTFLVSRLEVRW